MLRPLLAAALLLLVPATAEAKMIFFHTPSGNTHCLWGKDNGPAVIRCDVLQISNERPAPPANCDLDWGQSFGFSARGKAELLCVGDTVADPDGRVLGYGKTFKRGGIRCKSRKSGLRCSNRSGHGFKLSRSSQKLF